MRVCGRCDILEYLDHISFFGFIASSLREIRLFRRLGDFEFITVTSSKFDA